MRTILSFCLLMCLGWTAVGRSAERPQLIVVISVDQLAQDYLLRFADNFAEDGFFRRVFREGAQYTQCHHRHAITVTAPGHAALLTGSYPHTHGIVGNSWFNRTTGKTADCVGDPQTQIVGAPQGTGNSPHNLLVETVGDVLKATNRGRSRVFGVAIKARASILMSGQNADGAIWLDNNLWVTSTYYRNVLPGYIRVLNESRTIRRFENQTWNLLLPKARYHNNGPDANDWENPPKGMTGEFPHKLASVGMVGEAVFGDQVLFSPFGNELTLEAAREIIRYEELGRDGHPDILCINFSSNDYVGHAYGPNSLEVEDMTYQTDRLLGQFVEYLDQQVGRGGWVLALTADHGVAPIVEYAVQFKLPARRNPLGKLTDVQARLESLVRSRLQIPAGGESVVQEVDDFHVYLRHDHPAWEGGKFEQAQVLVRDWLLNQSGVADARTRQQLLGSPGDPIGDALHRAWHTRRCGDVMFVYAPYCVPGDRGTTHGSPWHYDTHVPLLLLGKGIRAGRFDRPVAPTCLAATASELLGIDYPSANQERPLREAITALDVRLAE
ncbi:MAG: alkaline phosphatase family protein [Pirellulaceae bacterium]